MSAENRPARFGVILSSIIFLVLSLSGCRVEPAQQGTPSPSPILLTPYYTSAPAPTPTPSTSDSTEDLSPTELPKPTATPHIYAIQSGDTLLAIAQRYNITLEQILAANPGIDPNFLIIGEELVIPAGEGSLAAYPTPEPLSVDLGKPRCYPTSTQGLWCLVLAENPHSQQLENVSALVTLVNFQRDIVDQQLAIPPLNLVPMGEAIPLVAFFPGPISGEIFPQAELVTALPIEPDSDRYINVSIEIDKTELVDGNGEVEGSVMVDEEAQTANQTWLVALAFDVDGRPIGLRKWESNRASAPGEAQGFNITVYSLGPQIAEIKVLGEARP